MNEKSIAFDDKTIVIRLMDNRYIVNDCPQQPEYLETLRKRNGTHCECMGVFSHRTPPVRDVIEDARNRHGNCAVIAWDGDWVIGILTFFPVEDLVARKAKGWKYMEPYCNTGTLAVGSCVLCSLAGHEYRKKGIGRAMAELMIEWAQKAGFRQVGAFLVNSGLASMDWRDHCRPPKPFWGKLGFSVLSKQLSARHWNEVKMECEKEMKEAEGKKEDEWKFKVFPEYFREFESSGLLFSEFDASYSLIRKL